MGLLRLFGTHEAVGGVTRVDHGGTAVFGAFFSSKQPLLDETAIALGVLRCLAACLV